jgi:hypothetical protein
MATVILPDNGQRFPLDDAIAGDNGLLVQALRAVYPEIGEPKIERKTENGEMMVTVVKQAGRKGTGTATPTLGTGATEITFLPPARLRTDGGTQVRAALSPDKVTEYSAAMAEGVSFPAVDVLYDGTDYWLWDGFHRVAGATAAGLDEIAVRVQAGTRRDAVLRAVGANATHGLPRTNADKRRAVEVLLRDEEWAKWSDREIARQALVSQTFVSEMRRSLSDSGLQMPAERQVARGGQVYDYTPPQAPPAARAPAPPALLPGTTPEEMTAAAAAFVADAPPPAPAVATPPPVAPSRPTTPSALALPTMVPPPPAAVPTAVPPPPPATSKPARFADCALQFTLRLFPDEGHTDGRKVLLVGKNEQWGDPLMKVLWARDLGDLPGPVRDMLLALQHQVEGAA